MLMRDRALSSLGNTNDGVSPSQAVSQCEAAAGFGGAGSGSGGGGGGHGGDGGAAGQGRRRRAPLFEPGGTRPQHACGALCVRNPHPPPSPTPFPLPCACSSKRGLRALGRARKPPRGIESFAVPTTAEESTRRLVRRGLAPSCSGRSPEVEERLLVSKFSHALQIVRLEWVDGRPRAVPSRGWSRCDAGGWALAGVMHAAARSCPSWRV
jgi:hypothetical protein